jgi:hypothetical protein
MVSAGVSVAGGLCGSGGVTEAAGAALVSKAIVAAAAGSTGVIIGAGLVSTGGTVAGMVSAGVSVAGGLCGLITTGAVGVGAGSGVVVLVAGVAGLAAGVVALAGTVLVSVLFVCAWVSCLSNSPIFWSKAERRAACIAESFARTEMKLAQKSIAQTMGNNLGIRITFFYAYFRPDATAFPVAETNFCQAPGME